jgi:hypothetical protein
LTLSGLNNITSFIDMSDSAPADLATLEKSLVDGHASLTDLDTKVQLESSKADSELIRDEDEDIEPELRMYSLSHQFPKC